MMMMLVDGVSLWKFRVKDEDDTTTIRGMRSESQ